MATSRDDFVIAIRSAFIKKGNKQRFSLIALIFFSIILISLSKINFSPINYIKSGLNEIVYRVSFVVSLPEQNLNNSIIKIKKHFSLYNNYEELNLKVKELEGLKLNSEFLISENKKLRELIDEYIINSNELVAKVLLDKNSPYLNSVIINKGSNVGIKLGMPVLSKGNLVGRIVEVNYISSRILLLNDLNSKIPAVISPSGEQAILSGIGQKNPTLEYLPDGFQNIDDLTVYTSGKDGVLFPGISIRKVINNEVDESRVKVKLFSDPNQILYVNVILDKSNDEEAK